MWRKFPWHKRSQATANNVSESSRGRASLLYIHFLSQAQHRQVLSLVIVLAFSCCCYVAIGIPPPRLFESKQRRQSFFAPPPYHQKHTTQHTRDPHPFPPTHTLHHTQHLHTSMARPRPAQTRRRRRSTVLVLLSFCLGLCLLLLLPSPTTAQAAEKKQEKQVRKEEKIFEATNEWQFIPHDASVPPGLHIKLDLSTGERLGKLMDAEEEGAGAAGAAAGTAVSTTAITTQSNQNNSTKKGVLDNITIKNAPEEALDAASGPPPSRHETMVKVLANLPPAERASMGVDALLASRPPPSSSTPEDEEVFWGKIEGLWEERQAMLQRAYDNMLKPAEELGRLMQVLKEGGKERGRELLQALVELEDWLSDVDMAQDFYTLGGWPLLVGRLGREGGREVRWRAAWAVGNAVKNDRGFQGWVLEGGRDGGTESALTQLVGMLREAEGGREGGGEGEEEEEHGEELLRKAVYALTSAARGNPLVQAQLHKEGGLEVMGRLLLSSPPSSLPSSSSSSSSKGRRALRLKLASFGHDLALEAKQGQEAGWEVEEARHPPSLPPSHHASLLEGVTTPAWCQGTLALLEEVVREGGREGGRAGAQAGETEKVLQALGVLHGECSVQGHWGGREGGREEVGRVVRKAREEVGMEGWARGVDPEYHQELLGMLEGLAREVGEEGGREGGGGRGEL